MKWPPDKVLEALTKVAWPIFQKHFTPNCCIAATRIGLTVLERFGIKGHPTATRAVASNKTYAEWMESGNTGQPPPESRYVLIDVNKSPEAGFAGHLVITCKARGQNYLLNLSAPQFHRPEKNILVPEPLLGLLPKPWPLEACCRMPDGTLVIYAPHPDPNVSWKHSPDWRVPDDRNAAFAHLFVQIVNAVEKRIYSDGVQ